MKRMRAHKHNMFLWFETTLLFIFVKRFTRWANVNCKLQLQAAILMSAAWSRLQKQYSPSLTATAKINVKTHIDNSRGHLQSTANKLQLTAKLLMLAQHGNNLQSASKKVAVAVAFLTRRHQGVNPLTGGRFSWCGHQNDTLNSMVEFLTSAQETTAVTQCEKPSLSHES